MFSVIQKIYFKDLTKYDIIENISEKNQPHFNKIQTFVRQFQIEFFQSLSVIDYLDSLMKQTQIQSLDEISQPEREEIPVGSMLVKEGRTLPMSETEDVGGYSLAPTYSAKQMRRMERLRIRNKENGLVFKLKSGGRLNW